MNNIKITASAAKYASPVGKKYALDDEGNLIAERLSRGEAEAVVKQFSTFDEYASWRESLDSHYMLFTGNFQPEDDGKPVVYRGQETEGTVSATGTNDKGGYLQFRSGGTIARIDTDVKEPSEVAAMHPQPIRFTSHDALVDALVEAEPTLAPIAKLVMDSSSANLYDAEGKQLRGAGGRRLELPVDDGARIPELLKTLHVRSVIAGHGWSFVDAAGKTHARSLIDLALERPHQPDYARVTEGKGVKSRRVFKRYEGDVLAMDDVPPLTEEEQNNAADIFAEQARVLKPEADKQKVTAREQRIKIMMKRGASEAEAKLAALETEQGVLLPSVAVKFSDGTVVTVAALLADGAEYDRKACYDPLEPDYDGSRAVGRFYWNGGFNPTIHSFAHGSTAYRLRYDISALKRLLKPAGSEPDYDVVVSALGRLHASGGKMTKAVKDSAKALGLGNSFKGLQADVVQFNKSADEEPVGDADAAAQVEAESLDDVMPRSMFPKLTDDVDSTTPYNHKDNFAALLKFYGITLRYNQITKEVEWEHPDISGDTDNAAERLVVKLSDLAIMNGLSDRRTGSFILALADENQYNPVLDYMRSLPEWDGQDRIPEVAKVMAVPDDVEAAILSLRLWLIQAVAAADNAAAATALNPKILPVFEYVLVLMGDQGTNKTKGLKRLLPAALQRYFKESMVLNLGNKDSVKDAVSYWITELGELDATFKRSEVTALKAFTSRETDNIRAPYARTTSKYARRSVFTGTVNESKFLTDKTGNRRYYPFRVAGALPTWNADFIDQLWAQVWSIYLGGAIWWVKPNSAEEKLLDGTTKKFETESIWEDMLRNTFEWDGADLHDDRFTATELYTALVETGQLPKGRLAHPSDLNEIGHAMRRLWSEHGARTVDGVLKIEMSDGHFIKTNADGGKNLGWKTPPLTPHWYGGNVGGVLPESMKRLFKDALS